MKVLIVKKENIDIQKEINILKENGFSIVNKNPDYILSFGGDGTILKALKYAVKYDKAIIPINYGRVAYMADIEASQFSDLIKAIINNKYKISKRYLLECELNNKILYALNDIVFKNEYLDEIYLYDKKDLITKYRSDGLIISTPTGSTAYAMSAGGSIIHKDLKVLNIVSIASQYLSTRPLVLANTKLKVISKSNIYIDGKKVKKENIVYVKLSDKYIKILEIDNKNYYDILKNKLEWR